MRGSSQLANLPVDVQEFIKDKYRGAPVVVQPLPYWSTTRHQASVAAGVYTIAAGQTATAFSYGLNQDMGAGGFAAGTLATLAETNLQQGGQTRDNADVFIWGLSAYVTQDSEPVLIEELFRKVSLTISTNGSVTLPLGTLELFPSAGGMYGAGKSFLEEPAINVAGGADGGDGVHHTYGNNGNPMAGNFFRLPQPIFWSGLGGGGSDNTLAIKQTVERAISFTAAAARVAAAGVAPYTQPVAAARGTIVDIRWHLTCVSVTPRSANA